MITKTELFKLGFREADREYDGWVVYDLCDFLSIVYNEQKGVARVEEWDEERSDLKELVNDCKVELLKVMQDMNDDALQINNLIAQAFELIIDLNERVGNDNG